MAKKKAIVSKSKMRRFHYSPEWPIVSRAFENDINPILEAVKNFHTFTISFRRKYLISINKSNPNVEEIWKKMTYWYKVKKVR
jgi:hypothetical protein